MAAYVNPALKDELDTSQAIYWSPAKLAIFRLAAAAICVGAIYSGFTGYPVRSLSTWDFILIGVGLFFLIVSLYDFARKMASRSKPALVISKEGLFITDKPLVRWGEIVENIWHTTRYSSIPVHAVIRIRTQAAKYEVPAHILGISAKEYLRLCDLYASSGTTRGHSA